MGNILRSPTNIGSLTLSDGSIDDTLYVNGKPIKDLSLALNIGNGTINGTLTQKNLSYNQMIEDFEPNMAAYVYVKAGNTVPASAQEYLAALQSSISPTSAQLIDALTNQMASLQVIITNYKDFTGTPYEAYNAYSLDGLIKAQLDDRWGVSSSDDLSNDFGPASDGAVAFGFKNKLYSPAAITFGFDNEAGDEGYPSESVGAIAVGYGVKSLGNQSLTVGKGLYNKGNYSSLLGTSSLFKVNNYDSSIEKSQAREYLRSLQKLGIVNTGYTDGQIRSGDADDYEVELGKIFGNESLGFGPVLDNGEGNLLFGGGNATSKDTTNSLLVGTQNVGDGYHLLMSGLHNEVSGHHNYVMGQNNIVGSDATFSSVVGLSNKTNYYNTHLLGTGITAWKIKQVLFGHGDSTSIPSQADIVLVNKDNNPFEAFEEGAIASGIGLKTAKSVTVKQTSVSQGTRVDYKFDEFYTPPLTNVVFRFSSFLSPDNYVSVYINGAYDGYAQVNNNVLIISTSTRTISSIGIGRDSTTGLSYTLNRIIVENQDTHYSIDVDLTNYEAIGSTVTINRVNAFGKFNNPTPEDILEIGNGTADNARHNAFAITESGYIVLPNFGSTTSTTPISYKTFKCVNGVLTAID